jgi:hypothetical protein
MKTRWPAWLAVAALSSAGANGHSVNEARLEDTTRVQSAIVGDGLIQSARPYSDPDMPKAVVLQWRSRLMADCCKTGSKWLPSWCRSAARPPSEPQTTRRYFV